MTDTFVAATSAIALLADLDPVTWRPERIHAVLAWTDLGARYYQPLDATVSTSACSELIGRSPCDPLASTSAQLELDVDDRPYRGPTSAGRTWRTWSLPSIPPALRHLELAALVRALADQLGGGAS